VFEPVEDEATATFRALIDPFFPRHAGQGDRRQVRQYVRAACIGLGAFPAGAPGKAALTNLLLWLGFTRRGGDHIVAPWSRQSPYRASSRPMIRDVLAFLSSGTVAPWIARAIERIRKEWQRK
jgi:hypothetical protein